MSRWRRARRRPATGCASSRGSTGDCWPPRPRFAALLLLGVAGSSWQAVRATQAEAVALANEQGDANAAQAQEKEQEANQQRDEAQKQRDEVQALNEKLQATQAELGTTLYAAHINLATAPGTKQTLPRVLELLEQHRPRAGEPDLRSFEWHYLRRLCQGDQLLYSSEGR